MRFCPFCGAKVEIPEQEMGAGEVEVQTPQKDFSDQLKRQDSGVFIPLALDESVWKIPDAKPEPEPELPDEEPEVLHEEEAPIKSSSKEKEETAQRRTARVRAVERADSERVRDTRVPQRRFNPNDIFMDGGVSDDAEEEDDYEDYDDRSEGGWFSRNLRGLVTFGLILLVVAVVAIWLFPPSGQRALVRSRLDWRSDAYATVANQDYQAGDFASAADHYAEALAKAPERYEYARAAAIMYYQAGDTRRAEEMARIAIGIDSTQSDPYRLLEMIYPDSATRPDEIRAILSVMP